EGATDVGKVLGIDSGNRLARIRSSCPYPGVDRPRQRFSSAAHAGYRTADHQKAAHTKKLCPHRSPLRSKTASASLVLECDVTASQGQEQGSSYPPATPDPSVAKNSPMPIRNLEKLPNRWSPRTVGDHARRQSRHALASRIQKSQSLVLS